MAERTVIAAVQEGDWTALPDLIAQGCDVNEQDEVGWTALHWAAGQGDLPAVEALLRQGADVAIEGRDNRTPLLIAKAAGHRRLAEALAGAERARGLAQDGEGPYCKAYLAADLERYPGFTDARPESGRSAIVYLHQDFTVTRSVWRNEDVVFEDAAPEWREFCRTELNFEMPEDLR